MGKQGPCYHCGVTSELMILDCVEVFDNKVLKFSRKNESFWLLQV